MPFPPNKGIPPYNLRPRRKLRREIPDWTIPTPLAIEISMADVGNDKNVSFPVVRIACG